MSRYSSFEWQEETISRIVVPDGLPQAARHQHLHLIPELVRFEEAGAVKAALEPNRLNSSLFSVIYRGPNMCR